MIRILKYNPHRSILSSRDVCPYDISGSYPWYKELERRSYRSKAYADAVAWAKDYEAQDTMGNMAHAHGVIENPSGGWHGVVNYFHSNT